MTCREKLKLEHPENVARRYIGGCGGCPSTYDYLDDPSYCLNNGSADEEVCMRCWDREIPGTEDTVEETFKIPEIHKELFHKLIDDAMNRNDRSISVRFDDESINISIYPYPITDELS